VVDNPSNLVLFLSTKTIVKLSDHGIDVHPIELLLVVIDLIGGLSTHRTL